VRAEQVIPIIKEGLEQAPIEERVELGMLLEHWRYYMTRTNSMDDIDARFVSFNLRNCSVVRHAGNARGFCGIESARNVTMNNLLQFCAGVC